MIRPNLILDLNDELIVDNFAGGGGASTGIERALGRHVDHAINHDEFALGMHRINHPQTIHHCEDVFAVDPAQLTEGRPVGMGWFSPDCKHFSKAKGGKPLSKKIRGLAFVILRWAKIHTRVIYMENVEEIQTWGPLLADGKPDPKYKGRTWKSFLACLQNGLPEDSPDMAEILEVLGDTVTKAELMSGFGYAVETSELRACDYGTPTIRKRLFLIARCDGRPIIWPPNTHANPQKPKTKFERIVRDALKKDLPIKPWVPVATCIDWEIPCHSIFLNRAQAKIARCRRPLAKSTMRRIATGIDRYVLKSAKPFLVSLTHQGSDGRVEGIDEPIKTLTGAHRGEKALVATNMAVMTTKHTGGKTGEPIKTVATGGHHALITSELAPFINRAGHSDQSPNGVKRRGKGNERADVPLGTQPASNEFALVSTKLAPFLTEHANSSNQRNIPVDKPMPTQCAEVKGGHFALVGATVISKHSKDKPAEVNIPIGTASARDSFAIGSAFMVQNNNGFNRTPHHPVTKPVSTITGSGSNQSLVAAHAVKLRRNPETHPGEKDINQPVDTISSAGLHHGIVQAKLIAPTEVAYYGNDQDGQADSDPLRTVTVRERFGHVESELVHPLTGEQLTGARTVAAFLREYGVSFEGEFATLTVDGVQFVIVDIGMRMLTARELFRAQGFGNAYIIDRAWLVNPKNGDLKEVTLTKEQQIRMCGNSVCPDVAEAIVRANSGDLAIWNTKERKRFKHGSRARSPHRHQLTTK